MGSGSFVTFSAFADGWNPLTAATNRGSILNTRHNLTMSFTLIGENLHNGIRNNYKEVCIYCHTPHGANTQVNAPLWNRTVNTNPYTIYDKPTTLNRPIGQPGPNSLTCLSCHDGTISPDSIINMPGSGKYNEKAETTWNTAWLDSWGEGALEGHGRLREPTGPQDPGSCLRCHSKDGIVANFPFEAFVIGEDLRNDHPVGIQYPEGPYGADVGVDFFEPYKGFINTSGSMWFHDADGDQYPDKNEPRMYNTGENFEVECASCHDPHGVPIGGPDSNTEFIPSFLRVSNGNVHTGEGQSSGLCLTCHIK
ncbi:MAG: hypothetical protein GXP08_01870 [Gammaproteobacteria bacterium]|nr:hypothetical protein [Gammaproteobacteria bacterium]